MVLLQTKARGAVTNHGAPIDIDDAGSTGTMIEMAPADCQRPAVYLNQVTDIEPTRLRMPTLLTLALHWRVQPEDLPTCPHRFAIRLTQYQAYQVVASSLISEYLQPMGNCFFCKSRRLQGASLQLNASATARPSQDEWSKSDSSPHVLTQP